MKRLFRVKANKHNEMIPNIRFHTLLHLELAALQEEDFDLELLASMTTSSLRLLADKDATQGITMKSLTNSQRRSNDL
jgi:hypothetical protein